MQLSPSITPSITRSSKRHTRKIICINPIKEFITRNLIRSHPPFAVIRPEHKIKISQNTPRPCEETKILPQKTSNQVCVCTINTCKAKSFIMQKASYKNKLIIDQEILYKIRNRQTPKLSTLLTIGDVVTKCILTYLKRTSKALVYDIIGSARKPIGVYVV